MRLLILGVLAALLTGCASLPPLQDRQPSSVLTGTDDTLLGRALARPAAANPGKSGIYPLIDGTDAFVARAVLANVAERSLDVQYYIWHGDTTGMLLMEALWRAAERGVRVRLLLDDVGVAGLDDALATLDAHPNIEVRLFNPFASRRLRSLGYLTDFERLNRRMHNKSLTADGQATIVGGRNIGNEYFGAGEDTLFADLDVLAFGPAAREVGSVFDRYWNSESAYPAALILPAPGKDSAAALQRRFAATRAAEEARRYSEALAQSSLVAQMKARAVPLEWAAVALVYDDPVKALGKAQAEQLLFTRLGQVLGKPERGVDIVSPYFVPGEKGTELLSQVPARGVTVRILTNSLAASDVAAVHAGYARRRKALLAAGVHLFEFKPDASHGKDQGQARAQRSGSGSGSGSGIAGSSGASLHAKTIAVDRRRIFVGSFNLDLRSVALNTEMGAVIDSPRLAAQLSDALDRRLPELAYKVVLLPDGRLQWIDRTAAGEVRFDTEPNTGWFKRLGVGVLSVLPIEWLL
jgi:putative cardiolipin synthase